MSKHTDGLTFGRAIKVHRARLGVKAKSLAANMGCSPQYISKLESARGATPTTAGAVATALGLDEDEERELMRLATLEDRARDRAPQLLDALKAMVHVQYSSNPHEHSRVDAEARALIAEVEGE